MSESVSGAELMRRREHKLCLKCGRTYAPKGVCDHCQRMVAKAEAAKRKRVSS